jgi:hypothetical protein
LPKTEVNGSRDNLGLSVSVKCFVIAIDSINGFMESKTPSSAQIILTIKVRLRHQRFQEIPARALKCTLPQLEFLNPSLTMGTVFFDPTRYAESVIRLRRYSFKPKILANATSLGLPRCTFIRATNVVCVTIRIFGFQTDKDCEASQNILACIRVFGFETRQVTREWHLRSISMNVSVERKEHRESLCNSHGIVLGHEANDSVGSDVSPFPGLSLASLDHQVDLCIVEDFVRERLRDPRKALFERRAETDVLWELDSVVLSSGLKRDELEVGAASIDCFDQVRKQPDVETLDVLQVLTVFDGISGEIDVSNLS